MADLAYTKNYSDGNALTESMLDAAFTSVQTYINDRQDGGTAWDGLNVSGAASLQSTLAVTGVSTFTGGVANLFGYRRPNLVYASATGVDVENNTGTAHQTTIVFPDGTVRSVTEDLGSTHKYRRFLITATAEFTSGTEDSGLRSGLSEASETWYAIYAVKSAIDTSKFVLAGDTTLPLQSNFSTLNSRYGTNAWVYLGMIRNGNGTSESDIIAFTQAGPNTTFTNTDTAFTHFVVGIMLDGTSSATSDTYTYSAGTSGAVIPNHITLGTYFVSVSQGSAGSFQVQAASTSVYMFRSAATGTFWSIITPLVALSLGIQWNGGGSAGPGTICLTGYFDPILANTYSVI